MKTFEELKQFWEPFIGSLIVDHFEIVLLRGISNIDNEIYFNIVNRSGQSLVTEYSNKITPLKNSLSDHYKELVSMWNSRSKFKAE